MKYTTHSKIQPVLSLIIFPFASQSVERRPPIFLPGLMNTYMDRNLKNYVNAHCMLDIEFSWVFRHNRWYFSHIYAGP